MKPLVDLTGKHILITGASRGIGRACALQTAALGGRVAVHYHSNHAAAEATLNALDGNGHISLQADIAAPDQVERLITEAIDAFGGLDVLVNNAGIFEEHPLSERAYPEWQAAWMRLLTTNLLGAANATYCAAHHMIDHGGGTIINISSRAAFRGKPDAPAYAASKAGLNAMSQTLAQALAPHNIRVFAVAPGVVETDMATGDQSLADWASIQRQSPLGRVCAPEEVARVVAFLAGDGSDYLTGSIIDLFGASYLRT